MQKLRVGDKIKVIHQGKEEHVSTIVEILEDYSGDMMGRMKNAMELLPHPKLISSPNTE